MLDESLRPVPKKDVDYKALPIHPTPEEYYLLSRVTGTATVGEICAISSMGHDQTIHALKRLEQAGLIEFPSAPAEPKPRLNRLSGQNAAVAPTQQTQGTPTFGSESVQPTSPEPAPVSQPTEEAEEDLFPYFPVSMQAFAYDAQLMQDESVELEEQVRRELLYVYDHLERVDYYQLFGLSRDATRKDVRASFFTLSKRYHPDLFYGKELGAFAERAEAVFLAVNKGQQILSHKKKRAEYDQTIGPEVGKRGASASGPSAAQASSAASVASEAEVLDPAERKKREMAFTVLVRRGEKYEIAGDLVAAATEYKKAFGLKRDRTVVMRGANLLMRSGHEHYEQAILLAMAAFKEDRTSIAPLLLIGDAYEELGRLDDALRYYNKILAIDANNKVAQQRKRYVEAQQ